MCVEMGSWRSNRISQQFKRRQLRQGDKCEWMRLKGGIGLGIWDVAQRLQKGKLKVFKQIEPGRKKASVRSAAVEGRTALWKVTQRLVTRFVHTANHFARQCGTKATQDWPAMRKKRGGGSKVEKPLRWDVPGSYAVILLKKLPVSLVSTWGEDHYCTF